MTYAIDTKNFEKISEQEPGIANTVLRKLRDLYKEDQSLDFFKALEDIVPIEADYCNIGTKHIINPTNIMIGSKHGSSDLCFGKVVHAELSDYLDYKGEGFSRRPTEVSGTSITIQTKEDEFENILYKKVDNKILSQSLFSAYLRLSSSDSEITAIKLITPDLDLIEASGRKDYY